MKIKTSVKSGITSESDGESEKKMKGTGKNPINLEQISTLRLKLYLELNYNLACSMLISLPLQCFLALRIKVSLPSFAPISTYPRIFMRAKGRSQTLGCKRVSTI